MDISNFMSWFVSQCVNIFTWFFSTLDNISFAGTTLLRVIITITILVPLLTTLLTLVSNVDSLGSRADRVRDRDYRRARNKERLRKESK